MSIESLKQQARKHEQAEDWKKALEQYRKALAQLARDEEADIGLYNRVGDLYVRVGQLDDAVEHYEKAVELYREAYLPNNAIAVCKKIIRNVPHRHRAYLVIGQIRAEQGFLPDARTNFLTYAERMQQGGDLDESFRALIEFCDLAPDDIGVRITVAEQMLTNGRKDDGVRQLLMVYRHYKQLGDHHHAEDVKTRILAIDPDANFDALPALTQAVAAEDEIEVELAEFSFGSGIVDEPDELSVRTEAAMEEAAGEAESDPAFDDDEQGMVPELPMMEFDSTDLGDDDEDDDFSLPLVEYRSDGDEEALQDRWASGGPSATERHAAPTGGEAEAPLDFSLEADEEHEALPTLERGDLDGVAGGAVEGHAGGSGAQAVVPDEGATGPEEGPHSSTGMDGAWRDDDDPAAFDEGEELLAGLSLSEGFGGAAPPSSTTATRGGSESRPVEPAGTTAPSEPEPSEVGPRASEPPADEPIAASAVGGGGEGYIDLGAMILGTPKEEKSTRFTVQYQEPSGDEEADFARMLSQFKDKVSENLDAGDVRAHYDLGTAYKEMGLLDEAISSFQAALRASSDHLPTYELLGQTFIDAGNPEAAVRSLERALRTPNTVEDELVGIYYYLGRAHEALDNTSSAVEFYDRVFALDINFADVTERLRELR